MKKNIFLTMAVAAALCVGSSTVATTFYNETKHNISVIGRGGVEWNIGMKGNEQKISTFMSKNAGSFPSGLQDDLTIRVGRGKVAPIRFNLKEIKKKFWIIDRVYLYERKPDGFTLNLIGKVKGNPMDTRRELKSLCRCSVKEWDGGKSTRIEGLRTKDTLERELGEEEYEF